MSLYILPDEILLIIFNYCDTCDLIRLNSVCTRFYNIISTVLNKRSNHLLVTSQMSEKFCKRCQPLLSSYTLKFFANYMWKHGIYEKKIIFPNSKLTYLHADDPEKCWSFIQMTKDIIVLKLSYPEHNYEYLCAINRTKNGSLSDNMIAKKCHSTICVNVFCNDVVVSSHRDNSIREWTIKSLRGKKYFKQKLLLRSAYDSREDFTCKMDATSRNIITGSNNGIIKIWNYTPQEDTIIEENITFKPNGFDAQYIVSSLAFDFTGTKFAAACTLRNCRLSSCTIYDINNCCTEKYKKIDINMALDIPYICQLLWEDPNTILCQGENKIIKLDVRTDKVVCTWSSLDHIPFSCISSDNLYAIMTGLDNGQVILWDQRQSTFIQRYNISNDRIWSLEFDSNHMFTFGEEIYELDFTKYSSHIRTRSVLTY